MNDLLDPTQELQVDPDASGEAISRQHGRAVDHHSIQGTLGDSRQHGAAQSPRSDQTDLMFPARIQAMSECVLGWPDAYGTNWPRPRKR